VKLLKGDAVLKRQKVILFSEFRGHGALPGVQELVKRDGIAGVRARGRRQHAATAQRA
jgi:hypothetical protein